MEEEEGEGVGTERERRREGEMRRGRKRKLIFLVGLNYSVMVGESLNRCLKFQKMARTQSALPGK